MALMTGVIGGVAVSATAQQPNVLLIIADDMGVDRVGVYGEHPDPGRTPVIDQLAADGVLFRNAWSNTDCSPSRATMLTGRYGIRTGIGGIIKKLDTFELGLDEQIIPELLPPTYRNAAIGKWHLAAPELSGNAHPLLSGFEFHRGSFTNLPNADGEAAYFDWEKLVDGAVTQSTTYATTDSVDEALGLIAGFGAEPWFVWLSFNAPHKPYHHPPAHLHNYVLPATVPEDPPLFMKACAEAMDTEMGRLFASMSPATLADTVVIFIGDNGTHLEATTAPFVPTQAKSTVFEGGLNVPLIVAGPGVAQGAECAALVNTTDIFASVLELSGEPSSAEDSVSFVPYLADPALPSQRDWVYGERVIPNGTSLITSWRRAAREERFKLHHYYNGAQLVREELYDLDADPFESQNLLLGSLGVDQQAGYDALAAVFTGLPRPSCGETWCDLGHGLAGVAGEPVLQGVGALDPGGPFTVSLVNAAPNALAVLALGLSWIQLPFKTGVLVPAPDLIVTLVTDPTGAVDIHGQWNAGIPADLRIYLQAWIADVVAPAGFAGSNALEIVAP
jgi:arylsulfatase B